MFREESRRNRLMLRDVQEPVPLVGRRKVAAIESPPGFMSATGDRFVYRVAACPRHESEDGQKTPRPGERGGDPQRSVASDVHVASHQQSHGRTTSDRFDVISAAVGGGVKPVQQLESHWRVECGKAKYSAPVGPENKAHRTDAQRTPSVEQDHRGVTSELSGCAGTHPPVRHGVHPCTSPGARPRADPAVLTAGRRRIASPGEPDVDRIVVPRDRRTE